MLFSSCGRQLKLLAKILQWLSLIAGPLLSIVGLIMSFSRSSVSAAAGIMLLICGLFLLVAGYIVSLLLYGFGIIVDDFERRLCMPRTTPAPAASTPSTSEPPTPTTDTKRIDSPQPPEQKSAAPSPAKQSSAEKARVQSPKPPKSESKSAPDEHIAYALRFTTDAGMIGYLRGCQFDEPVRTEVIACLDSANPRAALTGWLNTHP